jgi:hypothetical protein
MRSIGFIFYLLLFLPSLPLSAAPYPVSDDLEAGLVNWTPGGLWGLTESACHNGEFAVTDSPGGNYPDSYNGSLTLATEVDISTASSPVLIFRHKFWLAYGDYAYVEISTDGGFTWSVLNYWGHQDYQTTWMLTRLDLSTYTGSRVKVRFRLRETSRDVSDGWYIDKVEIREAGDEPVLPYPFSDEFEGTLNNWQVSDCEWAMITSECLDGSSAISDSPAADYANGANSMITMTGNIDLSSASAPVLIFWHKFSLAYGDYAYAEVSNDGGVTWSVLTYWGHQDYQTTWMLTRLDLSEYAGSQVKVRFRLRETSRDVSDGWYIDKVEIREADDEPSLSYPFSDDFEGSLDNWQASECEWSMVTSECLDGSAAITDSPSVDYANGANSMITMTGSIDLSSATTPVLTFWHKFWLAYGDYAYAEISADGGVTWSVLTYWGHQDYKTTWMLTHLDLSDYIGSQIKVRFRLRETSRDVSDGWYIDRVEVREVDDEPALPYPFSDDFERSLDNWLVSDCEWGFVESDVCAGSNSVTDSPSGNYPNAANSMITLGGYIDLSDATFPVLSFWHKYSLAYADYAYAEISTNGGVSWTALEYWGNSAYNSSWTMQQYDLRDYVGSQVKVRFRLRETSRDEGDGWYIDTVSIGEIDATDGDGIPDQLDNCTTTPNWCQRDSNGDGYGNRCDPDFNNNGIVDPFDFSLLKSVFGSEDDPDQDLNGNGIVDPSDFSVVKDKFGQQPGPSCCAP